MVTASLEGPPVGSPREWGPWFLGHQGRLPLSGLAERGAALAGLATKTPAEKQQPQARVPAIFTKLFQIGHV